MTKPVGVVQSPSRNSIFRASKGNDALFFPLLCGLLFVHLILSSVLPPLEDELYYWAWAQNLQRSYYDHPPMVAYLIRASTALCGNTIFGIRFLSCLFSFFTLWTVASLTKPRGLMTLFLFTPLVLFGGVMMTPDTPLMLFWALYLKWFCRLAKQYSDWEYDPVYRAYHKTPAAWYMWVEGGIWLGLGMLGKYTMALAPFCGLCVLAFHHRFRSWVAGYVWHGLIALLFLAPLLHFNWENQWAPLLFQWTRSVNGTGARVDFGSFVFAQALMVGILPLLFLPWILAQVKILFEYPTTRVCFWFFLPPFVFFLYKATQTHLEANWGLVAYLAFWPVAERLFQISSFPGVKRVVAVFGFATGWAASLALIVHLIKPLPFLKPEQDRIGKLYTNQQLARQITAEIKKPDSAGITVLTGRYQWVSYLRFNKVNAQQVVPYGRNSHFSKEAPSPCETNEALVVVENDEIPSALSCFSHRTVLKEFPYQVRNKEMGKIALVKMSKDEPTPP